MEQSKKAHVQRLLLFYLSEKISDPDKVIATIAAEAGVTEVDVWETYTELVEASLQI